jgi:hypothetical protein
MRESREILTFIEFLVENIKNLAAHVSIFSKKAETNLVNALKQELDEKGEHNLSAKLQSSLLKECNNAFLNLPTDNPSMSDAVCSLLLLVLANSDYLE